ncbi:MAG: hypothetical protein D6679_06960 [Candidatus Hydrogenedentota bacterium]|nr:MAG: hypothetical protein D6679_06960 [Candidatus Hydrogenedentota bacterium]
MREAGRYAAACGMLLFAVLAAVSGNSSDVTGRMTLLDRAADQVFGQPTMTSGVSNNGGISARSLSGPGGVVVDADGRLFISDAGNNRVLVFSVPPLSDTAADTVIGQPDFGSSGANAGGLSAGSLWNPLGLAVDGADRLYIADAVNNRILIFDSPSVDPRTADTVIGQPDFTTNGANQGGLSANSLSTPFDVAVDPSGAIAVADFNNNRVLYYRNVTAADTGADIVFGQPDFDRAAATFPPNANTLSGPGGVAFDSAGRLYVADLGNNRILRFDDPGSGDTTADAVFGQPDFTGNLANNGGRSANTLSSPEGIFVDAAGNLFAADQLNHRILVFNGPASGDTTADTVLGQSDFTTGNPNDGGRSALSLNVPLAVAADARGRIFVADQANHRVLRYDRSQYDTLSALPVAFLLDPYETNVRLTPPSAAAETFVQVNLNFGGTTSGALRTAAAAEKGANYTLNFPLVSGFDSATVSLWTSDPAPAVFLGLRTDTSGFDTESLPRSISGDDTGLSALLATEFLMEFADGSGKLIGDTISTREIGETFAFSILYELSETTTRRFAALGFDTRGSSTDFGFWYADTHGGVWKLDAAASVSVETNASGGINLRVRGVTRDLPGGLGGAAVSGSGTSVSSGGTCLLEKMRFATSAWRGLRRLRDWFSGFRFGRLLISWYYG